MKTIAIIMCILGISITGSYAQDTLQPVDDPQIVHEKIEPRELPEAVRESLTNQNYYGWIVNAVYKAPATDSAASENITEAMYIVELISGSRTKRLEFDKQGVLKNPEDDQD